MICTGFVIAMQFCGMRTRLCIRHARLTKIGSTESNSRSFRRFVMAERS